VRSTFLIARNLVSIKKTGLRRISLFGEDHIDAKLFSLVLNLLDQHVERDALEALIRLLYQLRSCLPPIVLPDDDLRHLVFDGIFHNQFADVVEIVLKPEVSLARCLRTYVLIVVTIE